MSPEQVRGDDQIDGRSDVYSMGVILYEALIGAAPFDGSDLGWLLDAVEAGGAPTVVDRRPELGAELSAVVEQAMARAPGDRFATAAEMAAALSDLVTRIPETLTCPAPPVVSRTDTEVVPFPPPMLLAGPPVVAPARRQRSPSLRQMAIAGVALGLALAAPAALRSRRAPDLRPAPARTVRAATVVPRPPSPAGLAGSGRTPAFTAGFVPDLSPTAPPPADPPRRARRARPARPPEMFRTPDF
jgi:serine/threonine-protein kinase